MEELKNLFVDHWEIFALSAVMAVIGQALKVSLLSKARAAKLTWVWYARKTLPAHPVILGTLVSFLPSVDMTWLQGALAGVLSTWIFSLVKGALRSRGVDVSAKPPSMPPLPSNDDKNEDTNPSIKPSAR